MTRSTRALVAVRPGVVELSDVGVDEPGPGEVTVRAEYSGISTGTDRWTAQGLFDWGPSRFPLIPGYQKAGLVVAAGEGAKDWIGRSVFAAPARDFIGADARSGGHAEYSNHVLEHVYALSGPPSARVSLGISIQVGYNAAHRIQPARVRRVVVIGDGIIGVSGALAAVRRGFEVAVVGHHVERLEIARAAGAVATYGGASVVEEVKAFRPEAIIDTIQTADSFEIVIESLPSDYGQVVYSGFTPGLPDAWGSMTRLQQRSITAHFQSGWTRERLVRVIAGIESDELGLSGVPIRQVRFERSEQAFADLVGAADVHLASAICWKDER